MEHQINYTHLSLSFKRIVNYNQNHQEGYNAIPHLCIKIKHGNGFAWFGMTVVQFENIRWSMIMRDKLKQDITYTLSQMTDLVEVVSSLDRIVENILEVVNEKKTSLLITNLSELSDPALDPFILRRNNNETTDLKLSLNLANGVSLEMYRNEFDLNVMSYGGFAMEVTINGQAYPAMLYHRSVILHTYIESDFAAKLVTLALQNYLPELAPVARVINVAERERRFVGNV